MIEPIHEKEARSDHHNRQTLRKPADRSKKFNQRNATKLSNTSSSKSSPVTPSSAGTTGSFNRTHGKRVDFIASGHHHQHHRREGSGEFGELGAEEDDTETEERERALMIMQGAREGTGTITKGADGIVLDETREAASLVPIEDLLAIAYAKKPKKSKAADRFDHIRGLGKQHLSLAPRSIASSRPPKHFPHEKDQDSDWESVGEDGTEAWDYNSEWKAEMGDIMNETLAMKTSYRDALAHAAVISLGSESLGSETSEAPTEKTDDLP